MAALLGENWAKHNGNPPETISCTPSCSHGAMNRHPASCACSHIWVAVALLSIAAAHASQSPKAIGSITPVDESRWISIERPFPAFALSIPEAADVPAAYTIRRHAAGSGRKDILEFGEPDGAAPYLHVEIYRPGGEIIRFADPAA
ncbi:MAG: hypothetical protein ACM3IH_07780, partial [Sphingobacteriales bacterium]